MIRKPVLASALAGLLLALPAARAQDATGSIAATAGAQVAETQGELSPFATRLRERLDALPVTGTEEDKTELAALREFYAAHQFAPLWLDGAALSARGRSLAAEIAKADQWGLAAADFPLSAPKRDLADVSTQVEAEIELTRTALKYGRYARGGRIMKPSEQLSSYLDRAPQIMKPATILAGLADAAEPDAYLRGLHPQHVQFQRLRQKYLALVESKKAADVALARRLLVNMEEWRWMPAELGAVYVWNNIPEFTQRVLKNGEVIRTERIVVGETAKQTPVFSRPIRKVTFKPTWIVPDSIKVKELWPSLLKGGGLMREWGLEVQTKDGRPMDWRRMDWTKTDIREYDVIQRNGPKSVMGAFKFSFPNQHTVFMHDTLARDKYMFNVVQRTYSHGCIRVRDPMGLAEVLLREGNGWDKAKVQAEFAGPDNNGIDLTTRIPVHITYFTVVVNDEGKVETFRDVYGHERRIALALEGKWHQIAKGRDHLAPVELDLSKAERTRGSDDEAFEGFGSKKKKSPTDEFFGSVFGGFF